VQRTVHLTASKRAVGFVGMLPRAFGCERDRGVELRVQALDARKEMLEQFAVRWAMSCTDGLYPAA
jgi:hypothetical protein